MSFVTPATLPQALQSGYASRVKLGMTSMLILVQPTTRTSKRSSWGFGYGAEAELEFDDDDDDLPYEHTPYAHENKVDNYKAEIKKEVSETNHPFYSDENLQAIAETEEVIVPIHLSYSYENVHKYSDFLLWNMNEGVLTPEQFAAITAQDLDFPASFSQSIAAQIKEQLNEYSSFVSVKLPDDTGINVVIQLSVALDKTLYEDKFEWDLGTDLLPLEFADTVAKDLGLSGEFKAAIAHALYESILQMKREVVEGRLPGESDYQIVFGDAGVRKNQDGLGDEWAPTVEIVTLEEMERREVERSRKARRVKRKSARLSTEEPSMVLGRSRRRRYDSPAVGSPW